MERERLQPQAGVLLFRDGLISLAVLAVVFAAFNDITTDDATSFRFEYAALIASATWLGFVTVRLIGLGHRILGGISLLALAAALWGQRRIGPGITPGLWPEYVATTAAFLWFLILAILLLALGWRSLSYDRPASAR